ncbi:glycerol-3-phosphate mitochondrial, partial [Colletotrichum musicola]
SVIPGEEYDVLVVGGGATGTGVALDAATRGLRVALVERDDFSSSTSIKSTKLVHGGVRYLEKSVWNLDYAQYQLVKEALKARKYFLQTAPHLSMWLPIMLPIDRWWKCPYWLGTKSLLCPSHPKLRISTNTPKHTTSLAGSEGIESSYFLTKSKALEAFPMSKRTDLVGALVYYDGAHNDSRMNVSIGMTAALYGATVVNHMEVTSLQKDAKGKLCGAIARDLVARTNGKEVEDVVVRARCIVNCTGHFKDSIRKMDEPGCKSIVAPASGVHVVLPGYYSPANMGLIDPSTSDGRPVTNAPHISGTELVDDGAFLDGTCKSHEVRLIGAHGFSKTLFINIIQHFGLETEVAQHLTESYGDRAWSVAALCRPTDKRFPARGERISQLYPFVDGEVRYAVRHEYAQTAVDVLARRTRLAFLNAQASLEALPVIIDIMTEELKWDARRQDLEWRETVAFLESMGLPKHMLYVTRKQLEQGKIDFASSPEYKMYSRHDGTSDD